MSNRIKALREGTGLSETQISSLLNISSYKYKRVENGSLNLTVDVLVLLSIMYGVPMSFLTFDRCETDDISLNKFIEKYKNLSENDVISILKFRICQYCTFECSSVNYRVTKNILSRTIKSFSETSNIFSTVCSGYLFLAICTLHIYVNIRWLWNLLFFR